jgi:hypothetical protein
MPRGIAPSCDHVEPYCLVRAPVHINIRELARNADGSRTQLRDLAGSAEGYRTQLRELGVERYHTSVFN